MALGAGEPLVLLRGVSRSFVEGEALRRVLDGADLSVARGERVALLGRSGTGKSTLLNLISGIDLPDAGEVHVAGRRIDRDSEHQRTLLRRRFIGFVFQFFNLVPTLTVAENLRLPLSLNGVSGPGAGARVAGMLEAVALGDRGDSFPDALSGGEQQRVALARALIHRPLLVLADEPTGNLDADSGERVLALMDRLIDEQDGTLITVTHSEAVAAEADRVLRLVDHRLEPVSGLARRGVADA